MTQSDCLKPKDRYVGEDISEQTIILCLALEHM